jgi:hypothetical protein
LPETKKLCDHFSGGSPWRRPRSEYFHVKDTFSEGIFYSLLKKIFMQNRNIKMEVINFNAAGVDVGSRSHFAAIGQAKKTLKSSAFTMKTISNSSNGFWKMKLKP